MEEQAKKNEQEVDEDISPYKILIIDDDMWIQRLFSKYLVEWGFRPLSAYDPYEGVAMAVKHQPLMIFLDVVMPDVQGEILLKMLKTIEQTSDIPVYVVSGNFNKELLAEMYKHGAMGFLSKPFSQKLIYDAIIKSLPIEITEKLQETTFKIIE